MIKFTVQEIREQLWPQGVPKVNCFYLYSEKSNENQDIRDSDLKQVRVFRIMGHFYLSKPFRAIIATPLFATKLIHNNLRYVTIIYKS